MPSKGMISRAFKSDQIAVTSTINHILCVPHRYVSTRDPLDPEHTVNDWLYWIADPWAECLALDIETSLNVFNPDLAAEDLVYLHALRAGTAAAPEPYVRPRRKQSRPRKQQQPKKNGIVEPATTDMAKQPLKEKATNAAPRATALDMAPNQQTIAPEKRTTRGGDRTMRYSRLQTTGKKGKGAYPKRTAKNGKPARETPQKVSALYNNEILYRLNRYEIRPLYEFGRQGGAERIGPDIIRISLDKDPTLILRDLMPGGLLTFVSDDAQTETIVHVPSWVYEYFEYNEPGVAYLGHEAFYVWYPLEVDARDAEHYKTYLSVVSRIDHIERLIRDRRMTGEIRRQLVNVQDSLIELTLFMMDNEMYTDRELLCPMWPATLSSARMHRIKETLPSGRAVLLQLANDSPAAIEASRAIRVETTRLRFHGKELGIDWKALPKDGTFLGEYGQDYSTIWHLGLVPDLSAFVEFVGMTGQRDKHDIPFDDPDVRDIIDVLQKACPSPLSRRDCSGLLRGKIKEKPLLYSIFYKMTIASLCGFYNFDRRATSFHLRSAVWRNFILDECDPEDFLSWMNAQRTLNVAGLAESEVFHKQLTVLSIISEYFFFLVKSLPQVYEYMTTNFYGARIIQNLFDAMDEYRSTMDNCLYGESSEWEHFQNNNELYAMHVNDKVARTKLSAAFNSPFTEYDAHFSNITGSKYDQTCFLPNSMMYCIIRFLVESLFQYTELFDLARISNLRKFLEVPYLWVCRGGDERDTIESIVVSIASGQISVYSGTIALAIRSRVLLIPTKYRGNNEGYAKELLCKIFASIMYTRLVPAYGSAPWEAFGMPSFDWLLNIYCGPRHTAWTDFRGEFYRAHGVQTIWSKAPCRCSYCRAVDLGPRPVLGDQDALQEAARRQYRRFQEMHANNELAEFFFGHRVCHISEALLGCAYHYRLLYMHRITHVPFTQHVVALLEGIMLDLKDTPRMQRISAAITEEERRFIALLVASTDPATVGLWPLLDPPLQCEYHSIVQLIRAKNLYTTNTSTSHVKTVLDAIAAERGRDLVIIYLFFNELFIRQSTRFFALPLSWTQAQIKAIEAKYTPLLHGSKIPRRVGMYYYCKIHGDFKAPIVTRRCGELLESDPQYQTSIGTTNFAVNPGTADVFCRTTAINPGKNRALVRSAISLPGATVPTGPRPEGDATRPIPKMRVINGTRVMKVTESLTQKGKQRRSKMTRLQSLNNMCIHPNTHVQMIGNMLVTYNRRIILCPRCATPMVFNRAAFDGFGLNCGQCTLSRARAMPTRISDFMLFTCILCAKRTKYYRCHEIHCVSVVDDTNPRGAARRDIYLCPTHFATPELEHNIESMTLGMLKKALACEVVFVRYTSEDMALTFGLMMAHTMAENMRYQGRPGENGRHHDKERVRPKALITYEFKSYPRYVMRPEYVDLARYRRASEYDDDDNT